MTKLFPYALLIALAPLAGCPEADGKDTPSPSEDTDQDRSVDLGALAIPATGKVGNSHFATAQVCADCHANLKGVGAMRDEAEAPIAPYDLWSATMMANSARDPYWRATVSAELAATPGAADLIGAECTRCHLPMAAEDARLDSDPAISLNVLQADSTRGDLARDGVSCSLCHQIEPTNLGEQVSFTGGFVTAGAQREYGPHANPFTRPMQMHAGFTPTFGEHVVTSEMCATCHQLEVSTVDEHGALTGHAVVEQGPYVEWLGSDAAAEGLTCAGCHLPTTSSAGVPLSTRIARSPMGGDFPIQERAPYGRHVLVGGNTWIPQLLRDHGDVLSPVARDSDFDDVIASARTTLRQAASVALEGLEDDGGRLHGQIEVRTHLGHKLPTAYPSRRVWLELVVRDGGGDVVLHAGTSDTQGRLVNASGAPLASEQTGGPLEPHRDTITSGDDVVVYEAILADPEGAPTFRLVRAAGYAKDTRLLPPGLTLAEATAARVPAIGAEADPNFDAGGDSVTLDIPLGDHTGPFTVEATLRYQPIGHRWLEELLSVDTPETRAFGAMIGGLDRSPETLATATITVP
jgi:hypothetical protein